MQTKDDISYGVIPLIQQSGVWNVFLIHQYGHAGDVYWTFPKGHPEEGETKEESARRELTEETGMILASLDTSKTYEQAYSFQCDDTMINKKVVYFKGYAASSAFSIQEDEVKEAGWYTFKDATEKVTHEKARLLLGVIEEELKHM